MQTSLEIEDYRADDLGEEEPAYEGETEFANPMASSTSRIDADIARANRKISDVFEHLRTEGKARSEQDYNTLKRDYLITDTPPSIYDEPRPTTGLLQPDPEQNKYATLSRPTELLSAAPENIFASGDGTYHHLRGSRVSQYRLPFEANAQRGANEKPPTQVPRGPKWRSASDRDLAKSGYDTPDEMRRQLESLKAATVLENENATSDDDDDSAQYEQVRAPGELKPENAIQEARAKLRRGRSFDELLSGQAVGAYDVPSVTPMPSGATGQTSQEPRDLFALYDNRQLVTVGTPESSGRRDGKASSGQSLSHLSSSTYSTPGAHRKTSGQSVASNPDTEGHSDDSATNPYAKLKHGPATPRQSIKKPGGVRRQTKPGEESIENPYQSLKLRPVRKSEERPKQAEEEQEKKSENPYHSLKLRHVPRSRRQSREEADTIAEQFPDGESEDSSRAKATPYHVVNADDLTSPPVKGLKPPDSDKTSEKDGESVGYEKLEDVRTKLKSGESDSDSYNPYAAVPRIGIVDVPKKEQGPHTPEQLRSATGALDTVHEIEKPYAQRKLIAFKGARGKGDIPPEETARAEPSKPVEMKVETCTVVTANEETTIEVRSPVDGPKDPPYARIDVRKKSLRRSETSENEPEESLSRTASAKSSASDKLARNVDKGIAEKWKALSSDLDSLSASGTPPTSKTPQNTEDTSPPQGNSLPSGALPSKPHAASAALRSLSLDSPQATPDLPRRTVDSQILERAMSRINLDAEQASTPK